MAQVLSIIAIISFVIAAIAFGLAIFFFIKFQIPSVIGDLSGRTARKSIAKMRETNEGKSTIKTKVKDNPKKQEKSPKQVPFQSRDEETTLLTSEGEETTLLTNESEETTLLTNDIGETTLLTEDMCETTLLVDSSKEFVMIEEIICIHTSEVIV